ncbi:MFS general substrate transporter [Paxillus ammoniavirescens]|nr:MFS general substrate transporter [Paxillus ammoniavirescens]
MTGFSAIPLAEEGGHLGRWGGVSQIVGPSWARLPSLTLGLFGVQVLWSVEMSYASPYLLSLGLSKSLMAIVFLAGPLSGLIVQPMIGILADNSTSRFGRRRPLIIAGSVLCGLATLLLGYTRPIATFFTTLGSPSNDVLTVWLAVLSIYCIDFSINAVQALDRALLVDTLPPTEQPTGNAWAARMLAVGSVAGFFVGNLDLPWIFPFIGSAQLEVFSVIASLLLFATHIWVCSQVKERVLFASSGGPGNFRQELKKLWKTLMRLPKVIRQICFIQFFIASAWLAWFPVLFYTTLYIGDLHKNSSPIPENDDAAIALDTESTRLGARALLYSALVSLAANVILPSLVVREKESHASSSHQPKPKWWLERVRIHLASLWAVSHFVFASCMAATFLTSSVSGATFIMSVTGFCWAITQWAPFALLAEAILSYPALGDAGSIYLADTRSTRAGHLRDDVEHDADADETQQLFQANFDEDEDTPKTHPHDHPHVRVDSNRPSFSRSPSSQPDDDHEFHQRIMGLENSRARVGRIDIDFSPSQPSDSPCVGVGLTSSSGPARKSANGLSSQAGAILGIHNMFIVIPQFLVTGLSSIIFAIFDPDKSVLHGHHPGNTQPGNGTVTPAAQDVARHLFSRSDELSQTQPNSIAIIFRFGGVAAAIACFLSWRLATELKRH